MGFKTDFTPDAPQSGGKRRTNLILRPGTYTIRVLQEDYKSSYVHWIGSGRGGYNIACLGSDDCPICVSNFQLIKDYPETYRDVPGWNPRRISCWVNVLDRTPVKVCAKCGSENNQNQNGDYQPSCWSCDESIVSVEAAPSNKVKIFNRGKETFEQIQSYDEAIRNSNGLGITQFDLNFIVKPREGNAIGSNLTILPMTHQNDVVEIPNEELFDLEDAVIKLSASEVVEVRKGVSLKDVFAARKALQSLESEVSDAVQSQADNIKDAAKDVLSRFASN